MGLSEPAWDVLRDWVAMIDSGDYSPQDAIFQRAVAVLTAPPDLFVPESEWRPPGIKKFVQWKDGYIAKVTAPFVKAAKLVKMLDCHDTRRGMLPTNAEAFAEAWFATIAALETLLPEDAWTWTDDEPVLMEAPE